MTIRLSHLNFEAEQRGMRLKENPTFPAIRNTIDLPEWEGFRRAMIFVSAYDGRHEPQNYGVHCADFCFVLVGEHGAISFEMFTGWHLPHVAERIEEGPTGAAVNRHSPRPPRWAEADDWVGGPNDCDWTDTGKCYSDGSNLAGDDILVALVGEGWEAMWRELRSWYQHTFLNSDGSCYHGRIYTGHGSRTVDSPLWSAYTRGQLELERDRRIRAKRPQRKEPVT